jgi:molybdenum cofactor guanylyltransferase
VSVTVAVLAGGLGSRIGGDKALVQLGGRPLITYPLAAAKAAGLDAVVVAKRHSKLPPLDVPILLEPDGPTHPLLGVITALEKLPAVIALPCDMPFVDPLSLAALAEMQDDLALLTTDQPFPSLYRRTALPKLQSALEAHQSMKSVHAHSPRAQAVASSTDVAPQASINTPEDLAAAEEQLRRR